MVLLLASLLFVAFNSGEASAQLTCPKGTHVTGGGTVVLGQSGNSQCGDDPTGSADPPGPSSPGQAPTFTREYVCGNAIKGPDGDVIVGNPTCNDCPTAVVGGVLVKEQAVLIITIERASGAVIGESNACRVPAQPALTLGDIRAAVQRIVPATSAIAGGTDYVVNVAVVFYARTPAGGNPTNVTLPVIKILGHTVVAKLKLAHVDWSWGDGTTSSVPSAGQPYDTGVPCESLTVCSAYVSHIWMSPGSFAVTAHAYWTVTASIDGQPFVAVPGGVNRGDGAAHNVELFTARAVLQR